MECPIKTIMRDMTGDGMKTYRKFLSASVHSSAPLQAVALTGEENIRGFFNFDKEAQEPQFLSIRNRGDLDRLCEATGCHLVVFYHPREKAHNSATYRRAVMSCQPGLPPRGKATAKYYDSRILAAAPRKRTLYYLLYRTRAEGEKKYREVALRMPTPGNAVSMGYRAISSEARFVREGSSPFRARNGCLLRAAREVIGGGPPLPPESPALPRAMDAAAHLSSQIDSADLWEALTRRKERILVACHVGSPFFGLSASSGGEIFRTVAHLPAMDSAEGWTERAICLAHPGYAYEASDEVLKILVSGRRSRDASTRVEPPAVGSKRPAAAAGGSGSRRGGGGSTTSRRAPATPAPSKERPCSATFPRYRPSGPLGSSCRRRSTPRCSAWTARRTWPPWPDAATCRWPAWT